MTAKTAEDRLRYAKQYAHVLMSRPNGQDTGVLLQLSPNKRIQAMKALSSLARFTGRSDSWQTMRQKHQLSWSTGTEKIDVFTRFFDDSRSLDIMLQWLREAVIALPKDYANVFLFCTLTGLRASEAVESIKLLASPQLWKSQQYYNPEQNVLQHYRFPDIFIRRTKAVYISVVGKDIVGIAQSIIKNPHTKRIENGNKAPMPEHEDKILS